MPEPALDHTYAYRQPSSLLPEGPRHRLSLVTATQRANDPRFFRGAVLHPEADGRPAGRCGGGGAVALPCLAGDASANPGRCRPGDYLWRRPAAIRRLFRLLRRRCQAGPSAGCGRRRTLLSGTTNVDFNAPLRTALSRLRENEPLDLAVGAEGLEVRHNAGSTLERKVKLPARWLRGFSKCKRIRRACNRGSKSQAWISGDSCARRRRHGRAWRGSRAPAADCA